MTKGWVDVVIRMHKPECKAEAKVFCLARAKEDLIKGSLDAKQYTEIKNYILSK